MAVIPPFIDAFATKNQPLDEANVRAILDGSGIVASASESGLPEFPRQDGTHASVRNRAQLVEDEPVVGDAPIICQVSRWDPLKDHLGLMRAFASRMRRDFDAHLVLAGPSTGAVDDDPQSHETFAALVKTWEGLAADERRRVHLCSVPMGDVDENAAVVNGLQRRSDVLVQKSLAEGFGLTVAEAMWKGRPTIGSRVGGIQDQIEPGESGLLIDPTDSADFASAVTALLSDPAAAAKMGENGRRRVIENYLAPSYLTRQFALIDEVLA